MFSDSLKAYVEELNKTHPIKLAVKDESLFMKTLSNVLFFNKTFMTNYVSTIGDTVYIPKKIIETRTEETLVEVISHEFIHIMDNSKFGNFLYVFLYLFPQILFPLSLLGFIGFVFPFMFWMFLFAIFALPIPSLPRRNIELNAYKISIYVFDKFNDKRTDYDQIILEYIDFIDKQFTTSAYYFMWPFGVKKELHKQYEYIQTEPKEEIYKIIDAAILKIYNI